MSEARTNEPGSKSNKLYCIFFTWDLSSLGFGGKPNISVTLKQKCTRGCLPLSTVITADVKCLQRCAELSIACCHCPTLHG